MSTGNSPSARPEKEQAEKQPRGLSGWDAAGILMGAPVSLTGLGLALVGLPSLMSLLAGLTLLLISAGLMIPGRHYERRGTRALGFAVLVLMTGVSVALAVFPLWFGDSVSRNTDPRLSAGWGPGGLFSLLFWATAGYFAVCAAVHLRKLGPDARQTAATVTAGVAVGLSLAWLVYHLHIFEWRPGT